MTTFRKGQKVRYTGTTVAHLKGKVGTVDRVDERGWVSVEIDGQHYLCAQVHLTVVDARKEALFAAFDILTAYMTDECPDDMDWEDFDPEVDDLRSQLDDLMQQKTEAA